LTPAAARGGTRLAARATMADLLDTMLAELSELTQTVADLEQQQETIRLKLANLRALQVELLGTADVLNRKRHDAAAMVPMGRSLYR
jgi:hypothetical protein